MAQLGAEAFTDPELADLLAAFDEDLEGLRAQISGLIRTLRQEPGDGARLAELQGLLESYEARRQHSFLLGHVDVAIQKRILQSAEFRRHFEPGSEGHAFVLSADIRRSTALMLKARSAAGFADFLSELGARLSQVIRRHQGVFDKFTGDGVLAFFPEWLGDANAALNVMRAASDFHAVWREHYRQHRSTFSNVLVDVGLGIGIDHGLVHTVRIAQDITIVGEPVVYASRLSGAAAGQTLVNQPAFEIIAQQLGNQLGVQETTLDIKHEGAIVAYDLHLTTP